MPNLLILTLEAIRYGLVGIQCLILQDVRVLQDYGSLENSGFESLQPVFSVNQTKISADVASILASERIRDSGFFADPAR